MYRSAMRTTGGLADGIKLGLQMIGKAILPHEHGDRPPLSGKNTNG